MAFQLLTEETIAKLNEGDTIMYKASASFIRYRVEALVIKDGKRIGVVIDTNWIKFTEDLIAKWGIDVVEPKPGEFYRMKDGNTILVYAVNNRDRTATGISVDKTAYELYNWLQNLTHPAFPFSDFKDATLLTASFNEASQGT